MPVAEESLVEPLLRALLEEEAWQPPRFLDLGRGAGASLWLPHEDAPAAEAPKVADWAAPGVQRPEPRAARTSAGAEVEALEAAVDAVASVTPGSLPGATSLERTRALLRLSAQVQALALAAVADVEERELFALDDTPSTTAWVAQQEVKGLDRADVVLARRLPRLPDVARAVAAGEVDQATAGELARTVLTAAPHLDRPDGTIDGLDGEAVLHGVCVDGVLQLLGEQGRPATDEASAALRSDLEALLAAGGTQRARLEACLLLFARRSDPVLLRSGLAILLDALLPVQHQARADRASDRRGLTLTRHTDRSGGRLTADLDDEAFEMASVLVAAGLAVDPDGAADTAAHRARAERGEVDPELDPELWPADLDRPRSRAQQRHDALKLGLRRMLDAAALGSRGKAAPHVVVTTSLDHLHGVPGALPGRTATGGCWTREQVRRLLCESRLTRVVLDARAQVVQVSHTQRTATALERLVKHVETGGVCQRAGCDHGPATGHRLVPHHGEPWAVSRSTTLGDTVLLCEADHEHELHRRGRRLTLKDGRVIGPDGWVRPEP